MQQNNIKLKTLLSIMLALKKMLIFKQSSERGRERKEQATSIQIINIMSYLVKIKVLKHE